MMQELHTTKLANGWLQVKVPLPFSLKWVNSYVIPEENGYTLIDPGLRTDEAIEAWEAALALNQLKWTDIARIIVTHQHPDHYGLSGYVQEKSGAPVYISRASHAYALRLWGEGSRFAEQLKSLFVEHGMPLELVDAIGENLASFVEMVSPQPKVAYLEAGGTLAIGGLDWQLIDAPGHASGGLCFYQPERRWMICGDQVLPHITPNVSVVPGEDERPLALFLASLEELAEYEVELAFPGHRDPFDDFSGRIEELISHHGRRLVRMAELLEEEPRTAFDLCEALFGSRLRSNPHNLRFAMAETLAHLYELVRQGRAIYSPANSCTSGVYYAISPTR
ncbi:MBL fold metallo-hydrolase [Paenibacillus harenae]|uniref:MBL fold metallo-hydrolase n=1 Tax=Paenibacillus harenae TaxID=306543 RepID=UPI002791B0CF|nr:MBL fold metallo-hydrolase [Paenibacillus harenae]MDQ0061217.1 glyoxylase-like metal-dependent hydrolase (beta-lactamase superfamily II) [Paenibacillus harenae]